jgi:DUF1680 family protein
MYGLGGVPGMIYGKMGVAITVNLYVPSALEARTGSGGTVRLVQETEYPVDGHIAIAVECARPVRFPIYLRIPLWCSQSPRLEVKGRAVFVTAAPGEWQPVEREWKHGDQIELEFPMGPYILSQVLGNISRVAWRWGSVMLAGTWEDGLPLGPDPPIPEYQTRSRVTLPIRCCTWTRWWRRRTPRGARWTASRKGLSSTPIIFGA